MAFPDTFTTARLHAERLTESHWVELHRMHRDATAMAHLGGVRDANWTTAYLVRNLEHWERHGFGLWILRESPEGEPVGRAVLRHLKVDDVDEVEVGYGFYEPFWGRGLATEITHACLRFGFDVLRLSTLVAVTSPDNHALTARAAEVRAGVRPLRYHGRRAAVAVPDAGPGGPAAARLTAPARRPRLVDAPGRRVPLAESAAFWRRSCQTP